MTKDKGGENMTMNSYQYGTSPRKYEPDYTEVKVKKVKIWKRKKSIQKQNKEKIELCK